LNLFFEKFDLYFYFTYKNKIKMSMFSEINIWIPSLSKEVLYRYGKNACGNFAIIDLASPDDLWFHISDDSSAHVIAVLPLEKLDKKQKHQIIKQGVLLCKNISKYKNKKDVEIIYSKVSEIEKTETVGAVNVKNGKIIMA